MKKSLSLAFALLLFGGWALAQDPPAGQEESMDAAKAAMMKYAMPGEHHEHLKPMEGTFDAEMKMWMAPGGEPQVSTGLSVNEFVLGGRWLRQTYTSEFMGNRFEGLGYTGYDSLNENYVGTWMDTMSTYLLTSTGSCDGEGKSFEFTGNMYDPVTRSEGKVRSTMVVNGPDQHTFAMFMVGPDGTEFKNMEIVYTRQK